MSWSLSKGPVLRNDARAAFTQVFQEQGAYSTDGDHKRVMDECADFASRVAEGAPEGTEVTISSYGHINSPSGIGQANVVVNIGMPVITVPPQPSAIDY